MKYGILRGTDVIAEFTVPLTVRSNNPVFQTDTLSLKRIVLRRGAQRWEISTKLTPLLVDANELMVELVTKGYHTQTQVAFPQNYGAIMAMRKEYDYDAISARNGARATITIPDRLTQVAPGVDFLFVATSAGQGYYPVVPASASHPSQGITVNASQNGDPAKLLAAASTPCKVHFPSNYDKDGAPETVPCTRAPLANHIVVPEATAADWRLVPGWFVQLNNTSKVYMVKEVQSNHLILFPELRLSGTISSIRILNVVANCYFDSDTVTGMAYDDGILMDCGTIKLVEAL
jgi:hypothetical protein